MFCRVKITNMFKVDLSDAFLMVAGIIAFILLLLTKKYPRIKKPVVIILWLAYIFLILSLTLQPLFFSTYRITWDEMKLYGPPWNFKPFSLIIPQWKNVLSGQKGAFRQFFGNIIMFIPAGLLMPLVFKKTQRFLWALLGAFLFTLCIESLQLILCIAGMCMREFDVDDLILNTFGAVLGYLIYRLIFHKGRRKKARG